MESASTASQVERGWWAQRRGQLPLAIALAAAGGFAVVLALVLLGDARAFDLQFSLALQRLRFPGLGGLMEAVSWFGHQPQALLIGLAVLGFLFWRRLWLEAGFAALALVSSLVYVPLKALIGRDRPSALDGIIVHGNITSASFPSGHVLVYLLFYGFLGYLTYTLVRRRPLRHALLAFLLGLIALCGLSRIYLGQHWLTDVLASYLLGTTLLIALLIAYRRIKARQLDRAEQTAVGL